MLGTPQGQAKPVITVTSHYFEGCTRPSRGSFRLTSFHLWLWQQTTKGSWQYNIHTPTRAQSPSPPPIRTRVFKCVGPSYLYSILGTHLLTMVEAKIAYSLTLNTSSVHIVLPGWLRRHNRNRWERDIAKKWNNESKLPTRPRTSVYPFKRHLTKSAWKSQRMYTHVPELKIKDHSLAMR